MKANGLSSLLLHQTRAAKIFNFSKTKTISLFEKVILTAQKWATPQQLMFVVGATQGKLFQDIRAIAPDNFLLVPGVGAQGGSPKM